MRQIQKYIQIIEFQLSNSFDVLYTGCFINDSFQCNPSTALSVRTSIQLHVIFL